MNINKAINERELINGRVKINKEEIHNIEKYEGDWKDDLYDGFGIHFDQETMITYEGGFKKGKRDGQGKTTDCVGNVEIGFWREGVKLDD